VPASDENVSVLIVDDSSSQRAALARVMKVQGLNVVGGAADAYMARDLIFKLKPQVLTLDLQMPGIDGLTFLEKLMAYCPMPVVILSSLTSAHSELALCAMELGAVEVCPKPSGINPQGDMERLALAIRRAAHARPRTLASLPSAQPLVLAQRLAMDRVVAIGASTGGTAALAALLPQLPAAHPPLVIVQHMPPGFTAPFAARLNKLCRLTVREARDGEFLAPGLALVAPAGLQMTVIGEAGRHQVRCKEGARQHHVAPSVDVLFNSMAQAVGARGVGLLLTGMGRDGAAGLLAMRQAGARCLAQDEASSVVWGMPGAAMQCGAAEEAVALPWMAQKLAGLLRSEGAHVERA
jgi:two-component system chemotaxis response regulator CheB